MLGFYKLASGLTLPGCQKLQEVHLSLSPANLVTANGARNVLKSLWEGQLHHLHDHYTQISHGHLSLTLPSSAVTRGDVRQIKAAAWL